jgi:phosphopantetheinyl transferase
VLAEDLSLMPRLLDDEDLEVSLLDLTRLADADATAARFLTSAEREEYASLRHPSRRREWLGARVCLKAMLLRRRRVSDPTECAIVKDVRGRPGLSFAPGLPTDVVRDCSLSHKGRFACACVSTMTRARVGVDVEEVSPGLLRLAAAFSGDRDALSRSHSPEERLALLWALKEACAKAVGGGIGVALEPVTCEEISEGRHRLRAGDGLEFQARHFLHDGYVVAVCVTRDGADEVPDGVATNKKGS